MLHPLQTREVRTACDRGPLTNNISCICNDGVANSTQMHDVEKSAITTPQTADRPAIALSQSAHRPAITVSQSASSVEQLYGQSLFKNIVSLYHFISSVLHCYLWTP